ncbi:MAG: efflux RND transporter periplasmic adaptor subunit [Ignavibacteria bacterium]|nr:efflux RND transporter periplasmic adaptor subunit [Ignavibacteria bacterium]
MAKRKKSKKALVIALVIIGLAVVAAVVFLMSSRRDGPILVSVESVSERTIIQTVSAIGKLQPELMVKISSEASGEIMFLGARDGDTVKRGDLLVKIQPDIMETQLTQTKAAADATRMTISIAKAELDRADLDFKRVGELHKKDYASKEELDRARASYQTAAGRYAQAQADYARSVGALRQTEASASRSTISSPMNGVVTYLAVERGEKVVGTAQMQGTEIMRISDLNTMNAWVDVDENDVAMISVGDTARIKVDALQSKVFRGVVYEISHSPKVSGQGSQEEVVNFQVRIRMVDKDARMRPGMSVSVDIETETKSNVLSVPIQSVTMQRTDSPGQGEGQDDDVETKADAVNKKKSAKPGSKVWVVRGDSVTPRAVETGISDQGYIEIMSGLKKDETIVMSPYQAVSKLLKPGSKIKVEDAATRKARFEKMRQTQ